MTKIRYIKGIPNWFTRLHHQVAVRRCRQVAHVGEYICARCGQFLGEWAEMDDPNAHMELVERTMERWLKEQELAGGSDDH
jgi:hypothetical protein